MTSNLDYFARKEQNLEAKAGNTEIVSQPESPPNPSLHEIEAESPEILWKSTLSDIEMLGNRSKKISLPPNPFYFRVKLTFCEKCKIVFGSIFLFPIRTILVFLTMMIAWIFACIGAYGLSLEKICSRPFCRNRRAIKWFTAVILRIAFVFAGLLWVKIKGTRAKAKEAPILVVVPHTSVIDAFPLMLMGIPTVVAKAEVHNTPIMGKLLDLTQPIYVRRDSASSRHNALKEIARRSHSIENWPQIAIFPEGTTTNYTGLAKFKIGAFYPGVPVQPVILRWPNRCNTTTWAFDGTPAWKLLFLMLSQFMTHLELEYLPVYYPSEDEQNDPNLYASNMQRYFAGVLKIPATDYEYVHGVQLLEMRNSQLPNFLRKVRKLHTKLQAQMKTTEIEIVKEALKKDMKWTVNSKEVTALFKLNTETKAVKKLIALYDRSKTGTIDLREYLTHVFILNSAISSDRIPMIIFMLYGENKLLECKRLITVLQNLFCIPEGRAEAMIAKASSENLERIDMTCFERIMGKRLDFVKLFAMEACGEL